MKKVMFLAALFLTVNVLGQNEPPAFVRPHFSSLLQQNTTSLPEHPGWRQGPNLPKNPITMAKYPSRELVTDLQLLDSIKTWIWDTMTLQWVNETNSTGFMYNNQNSLTGYVFQVWDGSMWINDGKETYTYDANNNLTSFLSEIWNGSAWENYSLGENMYNANNQVTSYIFSFWEFNDWEKYGRTLTEYDANQNVTMDLFQDWDGFDWVNSYRNIYSYNANNDRTHNLIQEWNGSDWDNYEQFDFTYDANQNIILEISQFWNGSGWDNSTQNEYVYDSNNDGISGLYQYWDGTSWVNTARFTNTYDANHNAIRELFEYWVGNGWVKSSEYISTYDSNNYPIYDVSNYFDATGTIVEDRDSTHFYFHSVTAIHDLLETNDGIVIFPNPNHGQFTISSLQPVDRIEIYSPLGDPVSSFSEFDPSTINELEIPHPAPGVYFAVLYYGKQFHTHKIIIQ